MATIPITMAEAVKTVNGAPPWLWTLPEAASQTFKVGALLALDLSGNVKVSAAPTTDRLLGIAAVPGSNALVNAVDTKFYVADDNTIFCFNANGATARTMIGHSYILAADGGTGHWVVATASGVQAAGTRNVQVVGLDPRDAVGDTNGRLLVMFNAGRRALTFTS